MDKETCASYTSSSYDNTKYEDRLIRQELKDWIWCGTVSYTPYENPSIF